MHALPGVQSASVWHGHAHFWVARLQRWVRQWASAVQGRGLGVASAGGETPAAGPAAAGVAANAGVVPSLEAGAGVPGATGVSGACAGG